MSSNKKIQTVIVSIFPVVFCTLLMNQAVLADELASDLERDNYIELDSMMVTSQKIEKSLQDTKESVAIVTEEVIEQRGLTSLADIYEQTPGISGDQFGFRIRGINSGQTGISRSELSSIYVDGVGLTGWVKNEGATQLWDVEQVEILRGPQSTNLGRNALAGAVVVRTNDPEYDNLAIVRLGYGEYGSREFKGVANVNLLDGVSALRLAVEDSYQDGYVDNITLDKGNYAHDENRTIRLKWLLEPTDDLSLVVSLQDIKNEYGDTRLLIEGAGFDKEDRISTSDADSYYALDAFLASIAADYQINDNWHFKSITAYQDGERDRASDFDRGPEGVENGGGIVLRHAEDTNISQELRFNFENTSVRGSTGFYFGKSKSENINDSEVALDLETLINDFNAGLGTTLVGLGLYPALYDLKTGGLNRIETKTYALFSEWEIDVHPHWRVSFGGRYEKEKQDIEKQNLGSSSVTLPTVPSGFGAAVDGALTLINSQLSALSTSGNLEGASTSFTTFLPQAGVTYLWNDDVSTSFFVKRGYRSGGTEVTSLNAINPFDPEYLDNYELSLRSSIFDGKGTFNANIYYGYWKDQQVDVPEIPGSTVFTRIENAGKSEIYGFEAALNYEVTSALSVYAGGSLSKTKYKDFVTLNEDFSGNEFKNAPEITASLGVNYFMRSGLFMNANMTYQGSSYADDANKIKLDNYTLINLRGGYENDDFKAELFVNNLFDEVYSTTEFGTQDVNGNSSAGRVGPPRQVGTRVTVFF